MESEFSFTLILAAVVSSLFILFKLLRNDNASSLDRIPGPTKLPVIGNLHLLAGKSLPHHVFRDLAAKHGPLMRLQLGGVPFLIVSSVELAKQVFKTHDVAFANRPPLLAGKAITYDYRSIASAPYGDYWRHLRKICILQLLNAKRVKSFRPIREEVMADLARWVASNEGSPVNLSERVYTCSLDVTTRASIGKESEEKEAMLKAVKRALKMMSALSVADLYPSNKLLPLITGVNFKIRRIFRQTDRILQRVIDGHRACKAAGYVERSEDLVDVLIKCQEDDEAQVHLSNESVKAVIMDMFLAGGGTSATSVEWAMSEMVKNPTTLKMAQDEVRGVFDGQGYIDEDKFEELKYLKLVIKETLRLHPPHPLVVPRLNNTRCDINGYEVPANTRLLVNAWALGRDPNYSKDAEKFMPERFEDSSIDFLGNNLEYIPFGAGRRICPGMLFGLATVEFSLAILLYYFDWKMPNGINDEDLDMTENFGASVNRKHSLHLIPTLRRPLLG